MFKKIIFVLLLIIISLPSNVFGATGDYLDFSFVTTHNDCSGLPLSIAYLDNNLYIGCPDPAVYKFNTTDGAYVADANFDFVSSGGTGVQGITYYQGYFWVADDNDNTVYKYNPSGGYTGTSFSTAGSGATNIDGITGYNSFLWVVDYTDDEVYKYQTDGTYTTEHFDIGGTGNNQPTGITNLDGDFYILDNVDNLIYRYNDMGILVDQYSTSVNGHTSLTSITSDGTNLWLVDFEPNEVYKYEGLDVTVPIIDTLSPTDDAVDVAVITNELDIVFDENIVVGTGNITIYNASDDSVFETLDVTDLDQVEADGVNLYLYLSVPLVGDSSYYVKIDATAVNDTSGNSFAGIADETTWNFTTYDDVNPVISSLSPSDNENSVNINTDLSIHFDEAVTIDGGNLYIFKSSDDSLVEQVDFSGDQVTGDGTNTININLNTTLDYGTEYYIQLDADNFYDENDNYFAGIDDTTTWNFKTKKAPSSGSVRKVAGMPVINPVILENSLTPCTNGALYSSQTGEKCSTITTPTTPEKFIFKNNLQYLQIHLDVKELQKFLNTHGYPVALTGPGSVGNETEKFGLLTYKALLKFQKDKGVNPVSGFFGPITRGVVNGM